MIDIPKEEDGPVVILRSEAIDSPGRNCRNREWEWWAALSLLGIAAVIAVAPKAIEVGAFRYLLALGLKTNWLWALYFSVGLARVCALYANGKIPIYGPHIRAIGCVAGAFIWSAMVVALIRLSEDIGTPSIGLVPWGLAIVFELRALHRALKDVGNSGQIGS